MGDAFNYLCVNGGELGLPIRFSQSIPCPESVEPRFHPVPVSQVQINQWWWQVKDWYLDTDFQFTDSMGNTFTLPSQVLANQNASVIRELNLISGSNYDVGDAHAFGTTSASLNVLDLDGPALSGGLLYPSILIQGELDNGLGESAQLNSAQFLTFTSSINANLDTSVAVPMYSQVTGGGFFSVTKFNLTPNTFWPY